MREEASRSRLARKNRNLEKTKKSANSEIVEERPRKKLPPTSRLKDHW